MNKRFFIAMPMPQEVKDILSWIQKELRKDVDKKDVKWVEKQNLHQTLVFLGKIGDEEIRQVKEIMKRLLLQKPLNLTLSKLDFYPEFKRARIVWLRLGGEHQRLSSCYHKLRLPLQLAEFTLDTRFSSHITLGRIKKMDGNPVFSARTINRIQDFLRERKAAFKGDRIVLYESELQPTGPIYTPIFEINLTD